MSLPRRSFLKSAAVGGPTLAASLSLPLGWVAELSLAQLPPAATPSDLHVVPAGQDRFGAPHSLGFSSLAFKVVTSDTAGNLFVIEHRNLVPDTGPALHLHLSQEEWFYVMDGEVRFQVGDQRIHLRAGESVLAPRRIPHCFSAVGSPAHMLIAFTPADKMEQYFIDAAAHPSLAATEDFMNRYAMKWVGPSPFWKT
ncbi:MAG: cupin domain-containing protein [Terracidiphilus sp.]